MSGVFVFCNLENAIKKETYKETTEELEEGIDMLEVTPEREKFERPVFLHLDGVLKHLFLAMPLRH